MNSIPPLTFKLLWAALGSFLVSLLPTSILVYLMLWPVGGLASVADGSGNDLFGNFMPWQLVTHLAINPGLQMIFIGFTLYFFGGQLVERWWGQRRYGLFLLACAAGSTLLQLLVSSLALAAGIGANTPSFGADGVMYGILFACAYIAPEERVMLMIPPIPMKMRTLVVALCALSFGVGIYQHGLLSQFGFLGGLAAAWLHIRYWRGEPPFGKKGPKPPAPKKTNKPNLRIVN
jgi:membrane associated rhomboid family serine protease